MPLQARFNDEIRKQFPKGARLLAAVSGGADSICLAELLYGCSDIEFSLVHCNFHLRGEESDADEAHVREWAVKHGKELFVENFDTNTYAEKNGVSIEMAARELRYRRFGEKCCRHGFDAVVTAHNANDNAETLVLNLLRGTGLRGLAGMEPLSPLPYGEEGMLLARPMLTFSRNEIEDFLTFRHVSWRNDSTNADVSYKRNRIRNRIFPEFEAMNPSFIQTLNEDMRHFAQARDVLESWYGGIKDEFIAQNDGHAAIDISAITANENWRYLLYRALDSYGFSQDCCDRISGMIEKGDIKSGKKFGSPSFDGIIDGKHLIIRPKAEAETANCKIEGEGTYKLGALQASIILGNEVPEKLSMDNGIICDASKLSFPFILRGWKEGDWMSPLGMNGRRKKLSDLLKDDGVGVSQRSTTICVADGSHVLAIPSIRRIDEAIRIDDETTRILKITITR